MTFKKFTWVFILLVVCNRCLQNDEFEVKMLIEIARHGATTPKNMELFKGIEKDLDSLVGKEDQKLRKEGEKVRKMYPELIKMIEKSSDIEEEVKLYSCSQPKCIKSSIFKASGVFQKKETLTFNTGIDNWENGKKSKMEHFKVEEPLVLPVVTKDTKEDHLFLTDMKESCPVAYKEKRLYVDKVVDRFKEKIRDVMISEEGKLQKIFKGQKDLFSNFDNYFKHCEDIFQNLMYYKAKNNKLPKECDTQLLENLTLVNDSQYFELFKIKSLRLLYTSKIAQVIVGKLKMLKNGEIPKEKYISFTANEDTLSAFLISVQHIHLNDGICGLEMLQGTRDHKDKRKNQNCFKFPSFRSSLILEVSESLVYGDYHIRLIIDGKSFVFCYDGQDYCRIDKFIRRFEANTITDNFNQVCRGSDHSFGILNRENLDYLYAFILMSLVLAGLIWRSNKRSEGDRDIGSLMD